MINLLYDAELGEELHGSEEGRDLLENVMIGAEVHDSTREKVKTEKEYYKDYVRRTQWTQHLVAIENSGFRLFYTAVAVISCVLLIGMLLFTISYLPRYGVENPEGYEVVRRYVEQGLAETGAINIIAGIILDYRAFDTLGESHVLFTALICPSIVSRRCVLLLLRWSTSASLTAISSGFIVAPPSWAWYQAIRSRRGGIHTSPKPRRAPPPSP